MRRHPTSRAASILPLLLAALLAVITAGCGDDDGGGGDGGTTEDAGTDGGTGLACGDMRCPGTQSCRHTRTTGGACGPALEDGGCAEGQMPTDCAGMPGCVATSETYDCVDLLDPCLGVNRCECAAVLCTAACMCTNETNGIRCDCAAP